MNGRLAARWGQPQARDAATRDALNVPAPAGAFVAANGTVIPSKAQATAAGVRVATIAGYKENSEHYHAEPSHSFQVQ